MSGLTLTGLLASAAFCQPQAVRFQTADGWSIVASYQPPQRGRPVAVLVHGVAAGKGEWAPLAAGLARRGIGSLALDLRGHGESRSGPAGPEDFTGFDAAGEWPKAKQDVEAAAAWLEARGIRRIGFVGASIGANLVSQARPAPRWLALLSPGVEYRGVRLALAGKTPVLVAASPEDAFALRTAELYARQSPRAVFLKSRQGHGAQMFKDEDFLKALLDWIERQR